MGEFGRPVRLMVATSAAILGLASCGDKDGSALPGGPSTPRPSSSAPSGAPGLGGGGLEKINACDLFTDGEAATVSTGFASKDMGAGSGASSGCLWSTSVDRGVPINKHVSMSINIRPWQTVDETSVSLGKATDGEVGGRKAKQIVEDGGDGTCALVFAAENGRVDIHATTKQTERSCEIAGKVSTLIEPRLPEPTG